MAKRVQIYSGRPLPEAGKGGWERSRSRLGLIVFVLLLTWPLLSCTGVDDAERAVSTIHISPPAISTPQAAMPTAFIVPPLVTPIRIGNRATGEPIQDCSSDSSQWIQNSVTQSSGDTIKNTARGAMIGGFVAISAAIDAPGIPARDPAVAWVSLLLASIVRTLWPLALAVSIAGMGISPAAKLAGAEVAGNPFSMIIRVIVILLLITPREVGESPPLVWILSYPYLITSVIFKSLTAASVSGWTTMTAYSGLFNSGQNCDGWGLLGMAVLGVVIGVVCAILSWLLFMVGVLINIYSAGSCLAIMAWLFDQVAEVWGNYLVAYFKLIMVPLGVAVVFVYMNALIYAPTGRTGADGVLIMNMDMATRNLTMVIVCLMVLVIMVLSGLKGPAGFALRQFGRRGMVVQALSGGIQRASNNGSAAATFRDPEARAERPTTNGGSYSGGRGLLTAAAGGGSGAAVGSSGRPSLTSQLNSDREQATARRAVDNAAWEEKLKNVTVQSGPPAKRMQPGMGMVNFKRPMFPLSEREQRAAAVDKLSRPPMTKREE